MPSIYEVFQRYRTLQTDKIYSLPIVILMPHSACNCRCVMCDIWKDNKNLKQLHEEDLKGLLSALKKFGTRQVLMSGGEALLNANFFRLCEILKKENINVSLLSTGLLIKKNSNELLDLVHEIIVSLDGNEEVHDKIRDIPGAYKKLKEGVREIKSKNPGYKISARSVIHRMNYKIWPSIIESANDIGVDHISFLPADVSSQAFNREVPWDQPRQSEIMIPKEELPELNRIIESIITKYKSENENSFITESSARLQQIHEYYGALYGMNPFPYKKCNAPWVSTVIEADGTVRPCFFHKPMGNIRDNTLEEILNSQASINFRKQLDINNDDTCKKCVCYLNLAPRVNID